MKKAFETPNYRMIKVSFVSPTNTRGSRIKLYETRRYADQKIQSKTFSYDYAIGDVSEQAFQILERNGFNVVARASDLDNYVFLCDSWGEEYKQVKDLK